MATSGPKRLIPPQPPARFASIDLDTAPPPTRILYRLSHRNYASPVFFSRQGVYRFDSPSAKWGVCYAASDIETACLEVFADSIRQGHVTFAEMRDRVVWRITIPTDLTLLHLSGPTLPKIKATLQSFVSRYTLSQEWGRAFMTHPANLDGVVYTGRQSGAACVALFGDDDPNQGLWHQAAIKCTTLGSFAEWEEFYPFLVRCGARLPDLPKTAPSKTWR